MLSLCRKRGSTWSNMQLVGHGDRQLLMWHKALQSACQKYLTNLNQKSEFASVISALHHRSGMFFDVVTRSPETTASSPGHEYRKEQEVAQDLPCDEQHHYLHFILESRALQYGYEDHADEERNLSSSNVLPEKQKSLRNLKYDGKKPA